MMASLLKESRAWTLGSFVKQQRDVGLSISLLANHPGSLKPTRIVWLFS